MKNVLYCNMLIFGDEGVGKTSILSQLKDGIFTEKYTHTIEERSELKSFSVDGKLVILGLFDGIDWITDGSVTSLLDSYDTVMIVYDVTKRDSLQNAEKWIINNKFKNIILVGNKIDLTEEIQITTQEGQAIADKYGTGFFETSAKNGSGVTLCFDITARSLLIQRENEKSNKYLFYAAAGSFSALLFSGIAYNKKIKDYYNVHQFFHIYN